LHNATHILTPILRYITFVLLAHYTRLVAYRLESENTRLQNPLLKQQPYKEHPIGTDNAFQGYPTLTAPNCTGI